MTRPPKAVILEATSGGYFGRSIERAFMNEGWAVNLLSYSPYARNGRFRAAANRALDPFGHRMLRKTFNDTILTQVARLRLMNDDIVLVLRGEELSHRSYEVLKASPAALVAWASDSLERCPGQASTMALAQKRFYIDGGDVSQGRMGQNGTDQWLPLGYDESIYYRRDSVRDIDVLILGRIGPLYNKRQTYLEALANSDIARRFRCVHVGPIKPKRYGRQSRVDIGNVERAATWLPQDELGALIARAKICVNIHQDDGISPVNPMFFAIPGSGACQITDDYDFLNVWLRPEVDYVRSSPSNFIDIVTELLEQPAKAGTIAEEGYHAVREGHTFHSRLEVILS